MKLRPFSLPQVLKMVAIFVRVRYGIPVVLMGECGCGKTELIKFLCAFLGVRLLVLNCHGGSEADVRSRRLRPVAPSRG